MRFYKSPEGWNKYKDDFLKYFLLNKYERYYDHKLISDNYLRFYYKASSGFFIKRDYFNDILYNTHKESIDEIWIAYKRDLIINIILN